MIAIGLQIILGITLGYILLSITESISHEKFLHATPQFRKRLDQLGTLGKYMNASWYSHHVVHHFKTFQKDYVTMFSSKEEEKKLEESLIRNGRGYIVTDSYGLRIGSLHKKIQYFYTHIIQFSIMCYIGGLWFTLGALLPAFFYVWVAEYVHPYLHLSYDKALKQASPLMRIFIKTKYFTYLSRHHFIHHKYTECNYSLMLGGDLFWRTHRSANKEDLDEMKALGLCMD